MIDDSPEVSRHQLGVSERLLDLHPVLVVLLVIEVAPIVREARHPEASVQVKLESCAGLNRWLYFCPLFPPWLPGNSWPRSSCRCSRSWRRSRCSVRRFLLGLRGRPSRLSNSCEAASSPSPLLASLQSPGKFLRFNNL